MNIKNKTLLLLLINFNIYIKSNFLRKIIEKKCKQIIEDNFNIIKKELGDLKIIDITEYYWDHLDSYIILVNKNTKKIKYKIDLIYLIELYKFNLDFYIVYIDLALRMKKILKRKEELKEETNV